MNERMLEWNFEGDLHGQLDFFSGTSESYPEFDALLHRKVRAASLFTSESVSKAIRTRSATLSRIRFLTPISQKVRRAEWPAWSFARLMWSCRPEKSRLAAQWVTPQRSYST